jgi:hypothetical protein
VNERLRASLRTPLFVLSLFLVDLGGARLLDALGLVESLLAPGGTRALLVLPLALVFYAARLLLVFVAPGLVLAFLVRLLLARWRRSRPDTGAGPP